MVLTQFMLYFHAKVLYISFMIGLGFKVPYTCILSLVSLRRYIAYFCSFFVVEKLGALTFWV